MRQICFQSLEWKEVRESQRGKQTGEVGSQRFRGLKEPLLFPNDEEGEEDEENNSDENDDEHNDER